MKHLYGVSESANKWLESAKKIAQTELRQRASATDKEGRFPAEAMKALADAGFFGLTLPTEVGGQGQAPKTFAAVVEELAQECASTAMIYVMHNSGAQAYAASKTLKNKTEVLKAIAAGGHLTTLALSEAGSRSQFWAPVSKLEGDAKAAHFTVNAKKSWVTSANHADSYVASSQRPGAASPLESTMYAVQRTAAGVRADKGFDGMGLRGNDSGAVCFEGLKVAGDSLMTANGEGAAMMLEVILPWFAVGTSAMAHGLALACVRITGKHLTDGEFTHNQSRLRDLPNLRARLAEMSARTEASRALLGYTVNDMEAPHAMTPLYVLQSRAFALETATMVTDLAMKTCGGAAFSKHLAVERYFRDARAGWVMAPTVDHLNDFVGKALTGLPLF